MKGRGVAHFDPGVRHVDRLLSTLSHLQGQGSTQAAAELACHVRRHYELLPDQKRRLGVLAKELLRRLDEAPAASALLGLSDGARPPLAIPPACRVLAFVPRQHPPGHVPA